MLIDFNLIDREMIIRVVIRNVRVRAFRVTFRNIYFDMFASLNPDTWWKSRMKIRFVVVKFWNLFSIDFMLSIELSGGFGLYFSLYFGDDCHSKSGKKIGVPGYCASSCQCGNFILYFISLVSLWFC